MKCLNVDLGSRSYPIYIGSNLLSELRYFSPHIKSRQILLVSNATVAAHYQEVLQQTLQDYDIHSHIIEDGEKYKTLATVETLFDTLMRGTCDRHTTVIALGGGVVGDIAGFAAACYQRGVPYIQVPTTLLSQVDSSVGGKTGVNHPYGKNMIGAFHQPQAVIADIDTLATLSGRELSAGLAEVIKYGMIWDAEFFAWLEQNISRLQSNDQDALSYAIEKSCQIKAAVVAADERESGLRAILNYGHTFGHAIESEMGYGNWLHGEAVAVGMHMAADLSYRLGWISGDVVDRLSQLLERAWLPTDAPKTMTPQNFLTLMGRDKKVQHGKIRLVLLKQLGDAMLVDDYPENLLNATLADALSIN